MPIARRAAKQRSGGNADDDETGYGGARPRPRDQPDEATLV